MIPRFTANGDMAPKIEALRDAGAVIIEDMASGTRIDAFNADLQPQYERLGAEFQNDFNGYLTRRVGGVAEHSGEFQHLFAEPQILALAEAILGPHCEVLQVGSTTAIEILPGEKARYCTPMTRFTRPSISPSRCRFRPSGPWTTSPKKTALPA